MLNKKKAVIKRYIITILFVIISMAGIIFGLFWIVKSGLESTFSSRYKTYIIELKKENKLICQLKYLPDFHDVFYEVDFKLVNNKSDTFDLGKGIYPDNVLQDKIQFLKFNNWYMLTTENMSYSKILLLNQKANINREYLFSPLDLRNDSIWKLTNEDIPDWNYKGSSKIDSISNSSIFIEYDYRIGINEPFKFVFQKVEYSFDSLTGIIKTKKIYPLRVNKKLNKKIIIIIKNQRPVKHYHDKKTKRNK